MRIYNDGWHKQAISVPPSKLRHWGCPASPERRHRIGHRGGLPEDETTIPAELQYVEIISVTASTGYDANTGEATEEEKELPSTVTFLVLPEQAKVLAELEQDAKLHLSLVYRGTVDGAKQFIEAQDELIEELYAEPEEESTAESENADSVAVKPDNEVME